MWRPRLGCPSVPARIRTHAVPLALAVLAFVLALLQRPGWSSSDTKIDLHTDPIRFLGEITSLWTPSSGLGGVESAQYAGYLFPMGPFFALGHALGVSDWLVDRLWLGLLLGGGGPGVGGPAAGFCWRSAPGGWCAWPRLSAPPAHRWDRSPRGSSTCSIPTSSCSPTARRS